MRFDDSRCSVRLRDLVGGGLAGCRVGMKLSKYLAKLAAVGDLLGLRGKAVRLFHVILAEWVEL